MTTMVYVSGVSAVCTYGFCGSFRSVSSGVYFVPLGVNDSAISKNFDRHRIPETIYELTVMLRNRFSFSSGVN